MNRDLARAALGLYKGDLAFACFGQTRPYKGIRKLVDVFVRLEDPRVRLLVVGEPMDERFREEILRACSRDARIRCFPQFVSDSDVQIFMNAADVAVLPYEDVLVSGSAMAAMSFGKAVIIPRLGCVGELLDECGAFLYDAKDDGLEAAMRRALTADLPAMGRHNYEVARRFDWDWIARKTREVYRPRLPRGFRCRLQPRGAC